MINNLTIVIALIGTDLQRAHSTKYKKYRLLKLYTSVIKQAWVVFFAVTYSPLKKERFLHNWLPMGVL